MVVWYSCTAAEISSNSFSHLVSTPLIIKKHFGAIPPEIIPALQSLLCKRGSGARAGVRARAGARANAGVRARAKARGRAEAIATTHASTGAEQEMQQEQEQEPEREQEQDLSKSDSWEKHTP